jgi:hypothetical protein
MAPPSVREFGSRAVPKPMPSIQPGMKVEITRSPCWKRVTAAPIITTTPAASEAGTNGSALALKPKPSLMRRRSR